MPQKILGIDLGSYSVKIAEIERTWKQYELVGFYEQPLQSAEILGKEKATLQALIKLVEEYNLHSEFIYTALPGQYVSHRTLELPFNDFKKIDSTIEFELENYLPLTIEDMAVDYQILEMGKALSKVEVGYARKSDFVKILNILSEASVDSRFVGSEPIELKHILNFGMVQPEGAYAVIDLGHEKTNILIYSGGKQKFNRTIMMGGKHLTDAIAQKMNIPHSEAERMKVEMGQVGPSADNADTTTRQIAQALTPPLLELLLHLRQTFMAYQQMTEEVVQAVMLTGGTSRLPGLDLFISMELKKNVSFLEILDFPQNHLSDSTWCRPIAATALSLAYRGVIGATIRDMQFRRGEFAYLGEVKEVTGLTKQIAVLVGVVLFFGFTTFGVDYFILKEQIKSHQEKLAASVSKIFPNLSQKTMKSPSTLLSTIGGKIGEVAEKKKKIDDETKLSAVEVLRQFSMSLPPKEELVLDIDDFSLVGKKIHIQGRTSSFPDVETLKGALSKNSFFKNVATENVNVKKGSGKDPKDEIKFTLNLEINDDPTEAAVTAGVANGP